MSCHCSALSRNASPTFIAIREARPPASRIVQDDGALVLEVRDKGEGMPAERLSEIQSRGSGVGIRGMRERVLQLSGTMSIESDGSGTRIHVVIPIPKTASRERTGSDEPLQTAV